MDCFQYSFWFDENAETSLFGSADSAVYENLVLCCGIFKLFKSIQMYAPLPYHYHGAAVTVNRFSGFLAVIKTGGLFRRRERKAAAAMQRNNVSTAVTRGGWHGALAISRNSPASIHVHTHLSAKPHKELLSSPLVVSDEPRSSWRRTHKWETKRGRDGKKREERKKRDS